MGKNNYISIKKNDDFKKVYDKRKSAANKHLVIYIRRNNFDFNRIGVSVSKKVGNSVVRHHIKRRIIEIYRLSSKLKKGYDIVLVARNAAAEASYNEIEKSFYNLCRRMNLC